MKKKRVVDLKDRWGESIKSFAEKMVEKAKEEKRKIVWVFNGVKLQAKPGDTPDAIISFFTEINARRSPVKTKKRVGGWTKAEMEYLNHLEKGVAFGLIEKRLFKISGVKRPFATIQKYIRRMQEKAMKEISQGIAAAKRDTITEGRVAEEAKKIYAEIRERLEVVDNRASSLVDLVRFLEEENAILRELRGKAELFDRMMQLAQDVEMDR